MIGLAAMNLLSRVVNSWGLSYGLMDRCRLIE